MTTAYIDPETHLLEAIRLWALHEELVWEKLCARWARRQNWELPTRIYRIRSPKFEMELTYYDFDEK